MLGRTVQTRRRIAMTPRFTGSRESPDKTEKELEFPHECDA